MSEYIREDQERRAREDQRRKDRTYDDRDFRAREVPQREPMERLADVVNDPAIQIDSAMMKSINDPNQVMLPSGEVAKVTRRMSRRSNQFRRDLILPRKRKAKKNPKLAAAFVRANEMGRKKKGKGFKKGWNQSRIAKTAHRLHKRMK